MGVVAAYREDGEVDGQAWQALYRKPLTDTDPSKRENRPPGEPDPADAAGHARRAAEEPLLKHLQAAARGWSFDRQADARSPERR